MLKWLPSIGARSLRRDMSPRAPLVVIVGATGTGKSQLAVEIATRYNGEIVNGDAMQLYSGLPIITNKIPQHEQNGVPHHLLGCIQLDQPTWTVSNFVTSALQTIADIRDRGRLPVLVGGTHYYTQSLLFHDALTEKPSTKEGDENQAADLVAKRPILDASTSELLAKLTEVDPIMAQRWHPNDRRKIRRSLEIFYQTGRQASDIYAEQRSRRNGATTADPDSDREESASRLRTDTLILWTHASTAALRERLEIRVDNMMEAGLLDEVETLAQTAEKSAKEGRPIDPTTGIWVAIGYKEFLAYRALQKASEPDEKIPETSKEASAPTEKAKSPLEKELEAAIVRTKISTSQYAKRQVRWIRIKLLNALREANALDRFFLFDTSDTSSKSVYDANVTSPALDVVGRWLHGEATPTPTELNSLAAEILESSSRSSHAQAIDGPVDQRVSIEGNGIGSATTKLERRECDLCETVTVTKRDWSQHLRSRKHKVLSAKARQIARRGFDAGTSRTREGGAAGGGDGSDPRAKLKAKAVVDEESEDDALDPAAIPDVSSLEEGVSAEHKGMHASE